MLTGIKNMFTRKRTARDGFSRSPAQIRALEKAAQKLREQRREAAKEHRIRTAIRNNIAEREGFKRRMTRRAEVEAAASKHPDRMVHCTVCNNFTHADHFCKSCGAHPAGSGRKGRRRKSHRKSHRRSYTKPYKGSMNNRHTRKLRR